jgi:endonuclease/exonuclease/phosphatase family metal-dependent hydrolase
MATGKITTFNMDTSLCAGKQQDDLIEIIENVNPDILTIQEADSTRLRQIKPVEFGTGQVMTDAGTMDTAVMYKHSKFTHVKSEVVKILRGDPAGTNQKARYVAITTLENKVGGRRTRVMSVNFPSRPARLLSVLQTPMARNLVRVANEKRTANFIIGGDFNFQIDNDPYNIATLANLGKAYIGRVGFYLTDTMLPGSIVEETAWRVDSDHLPVTLTIEI